MRATISLILLATACTLLAFSAIAEDEIIPTLVYRERTYTNAVITKITLRDAYIRITPGVVPIPTKDLPEPFRAKYYHPEKIAAEEEAKGQKVMAQRQAILEARQRQEAQLQEKYKPKRVIDGALYDFTEIFRWKYISDNPGRHSNFDSHIVSGKVMSVTSEGVLLKETGSDLFLFVKNPPNLSILLDDITINVVGRFTGRYQYTSALGATRTVPLFDCGRIYDPKEDAGKFKSIIRIEAQTDVTIDLVEIVK